MKQREADNEKILKDKALETAWLERIREEEEAQNKKKRKEEEDA